MRKSRRMLYLAIITLTFVVGVASVAAGVAYGFSVKLKKNSAWTEMEKHTMTTTANEGYVTVSSLGGASSVAFKARGQYWDGRNWIYTKYGPTSTITRTGRFFVYYMQSLSSSMPVYLSVRNNTSTTSRPTVDGSWQFDR